LPGIQYRQWNADEPVFEISDAIFRPNLKHLELAENPLASPGSFVIDGDGRAFLVVGANPAPDVVSYVDMATGEVFSPRRIRAVGEPDTLMEFGRTQAAKSVAA
jgi:hypothetical protein